MRSPNVESLNPPSRQARIRLSTRSSRSGSDRLSQSRKIGSTLCGNRSSVYAADVAPASAAALRIAGTSLSFQAGNHRRDHHTHWYASRRQLTNRTQASLRSTGAWLHRAGEFGIERCDRNANAGKAMPPPSERTDQDREQPTRSL